MISISIVLLQLLQGGIPLALAWLLKSLFDLLMIGFQDRELPWHDLTRVLALQVILTVAASLLTSLNGYLNNELSRQLNLTTQLKLYHKLNGVLGLEPFENPRTQNVIQMGMAGAQMGPEQILGIILQLISSMVTITGFMGVLLVFNPLLALLVILATLPQLFVQLRMGGLRFRLAFENTPKQRLVGYYGALLSGPFYAKELLIFSLGNYFLDAFRSLTNEINKSQRIQQQRELRWELGSNFFSTLISSGTFVIVVLQAFARNLSVGDVSLYTSAVGNIQSAFSSVIFGLAGLNEAVLFFSRYTEAMALPQPIVISHEPRPVAQLKSAIEFRGVSYRYRGDKSWVLKDVNLNLVAGKSLALVGLNGAGKTTLVKLLTRMYDPVEGQILWDGVDIRQFDPIEFRQHIGTIFQDFVRFDLTAFKNIALGDVKCLAPHNKEAYSRVREVATQAGIHQTIQALPQGYETVLSRWLADEDQGIDLSGGEWQKMAIARMLMRNAELLILDEPTSALDAQSEYDLYNRFVELIAGRTSLLISHRFSSVRMADYIAVLRDGQIAEYGSHAELMARKGEYARLYQMQADRYR